MNMKKGLASAAVSATLLFYSFATPAFAANTISISGNGAESTNTSTVTNSQTTSVVQDNNAHITNNVSSDLDTGHNSSSLNTGGSTSIDTGNASATTNVSTAANMNSASVGNCNGCSTSSAVTISGNGALSNNDATVTNTGSTSVFQNNDANIVNRISSNQNTGGNDAGLNTGGSVSVRTGNASSNNTITNRANANEATIGSGAGVSGAGTSTLTISGNGAESTNAIALVNNPSTTLVQGNSARILNSISSVLDSGHNTANLNTGGNVRITTGSVSDTNSVDNRANFNAADLSCGCATGVDASISSNGALSDNAIDYLGLGDTSVFQGGQRGNLADFTNMLSSDNDTHRNDAGLNTAPVSGGALYSVSTGNSTSTNRVSNSGNVNLFGMGTTGMSLGGLNMSFNFDLQALLSMLHLM